MTSKKENNSSNTSQQKFTFCPIVINDEEKGGYFSINYRNKPRAKEDTCFFPTHFERKSDELGSSFYGLCLYSNLKITKEYDDKLLKIERKLLKVLKKIKTPDLFLFLPLNVSIILVEREKILVLNKNKTFSRSNYNLETRLRFYAHDQKEAQTEIFDYGHLPIVRKKTAKDEKIFSTESENGESKKNKLTGYDRNLDIFGQFEECKENGEDVRELRKLIQKTNYKDSVIDILVKENEFRVYDISRVEFIFLLTTRSGGCVELFLENFQKTKQKTKLKKFCDYKKALEDACTNFPENICKSLSKDLESDEEFVSNTLGVLEFFYFPKL